MVDGVNHEINISNQYLPHLVISPPPPPLYLQPPPAHQYTTSPKQNNSQARIFCSGLTGAQSNYLLLTRAGLFCLDLTNIDWLTDIGNVDVLSLKKTINFLRFNDKYDFLVDWLQVILKDVSFLASQEHGRRLPSEWSREEQHSHDLS